MKPRQPRAIARDRQRRAGLPADWSPCPVVITRYRYRSRPGAPSETHSPSSPTAGWLEPTPAGGHLPISQPPVTLHQILDAFAQLPNPQDRVFVGLLPGLPEPSAGDEAPDCPSPAFSGLPPSIGNLPIVSGFAIPGSRIEAQFTDELGITQDRVTVHADESGHWIAQTHEVPRLLDTRSVKLEITPPLWSGEIQAETYLIPFPSEALANQSISSTSLIGTVMPTERLGGPPGAQLTW